MATHYQPVPPPDSKRFAEGHIVIHDPRSAWIKRNGELVPYDRQRERAEARADG